MRPKDILSRLFWDSRLKPEDYSITFIHRGAPGDSKTISCSSVTKAGKSWFLFTEANTEVFIPYHRILEIKNIKTNDVLWKKISR